MALIAGVLSRSIEPGKQEKVPYLSDDEQSIRGAEMRQY
jgi:hypothetical protein